MNLICTAVFTFKTLFRLDYKQGIEQCTTNQKCVFHQFTLYHTDGNIKH